MLVAQNYVIWNCFLSRKTWKFLPLHYAGFTVTFSELWSICSISLSVNYWSDKLIIFSIDLILNTWFLILGTIETQKETLNLHLHGTV